MVYKIRISYETQPEQVIQGSSCVLIITIKNIGDNPFPGGTFSLLRTRQSNGLATVYNPSSLPKIPELQTNEDFTHRTEVDTLIDGLTWVDIGIEASDNMKIEYYQKAEYPLTSKNWLLPFLIRNKENHEIIQLLKNIEKKLDNLSKPGE